MLKTRHLALLLPLIASLVGCGGGGGGGGAAGFSSGGTSVQSAAQTAPHVLMAIAVTPANSGVDTGKSVQLTATGLYQDGTSADVTASASFTSSDTTLVVVTAHGFATAGSTAGTAVVTAALSGVAGATNLTVRSLASLAVRPGNPLSAPGTTRQFRAIGSFTDGTRRDVTDTVNWSASGTAGTVSNASGSRGRFTVSGSVGQTAVVTATSGGVSNSQTLTVGLFFYVANTDTNTISGYAVNPGSGALTPASGSPFAAGGVYPLGVHVSPSGRLAMVPNRDSGAVRAFSIDPASGALTPAGASAAVGAQPDWISIDPLERFAYVTCPNGVYGFTIAADGSLSPMAGSPFTNIGVGDTAVDAGGNYLYMVHYGPGKGITGGVSAFAIDPASGRPAEIAGSPYATGVSGADSLTFAGANRLYVVNSAPTLPSVTAFNVNPATGELALGATTAVQGGANTPSPRGIAVDPGGRYVYVADRANNLVESFAVTSNQGALTAVSGSPYATGVNPFSLAVDPSGAFLSSGDYGIDGNTGSLGRFVVNLANGTLTPMSGSPNATGTRPAGIAFTP